MSKQTLADLQLTVTSNLSTVREQSMVAENASHMYQSHMGMFNMAAIAGNKESMEKERNDLHTLLDSLLDATMLTLQAQKAMEAAVAEIQQRQLRGW